MSPKYRGEGHHLCCGAGTAGTAGSKTKPNSETAVNVTDKTPQTNLGSTPERTTTKPAEPTKEAEPVKSVEPVKEVEPKIAEEYWETCFKSTEYDKAKMLALYGTENKLQKQQIMQIMTDFGKYSMQHLSSQFEVLSGGVEVTEVVAAAFKSVSEDEKGRFEDEKKKMLQWYGDNYAATDKNLESLFSADGLDKDGDGKIDSEELDNWPLFKTFPKCNVTTSNGKFKLSQGVWQFTEPKRSESPVKRLGDTLRSLSPIGWFRGSPATSPATEAPLVDKNLIE